MVMATEAKTLLMCCALSLLTERSLLSATFQRTHSTVYLACSKLSSRRVARWFINFLCCL